MDRSEVKELHFITPLANVPSIVAHGIVSNERAVLIDGAVSIAMQEIQDRRDGVRVPGGLPLHQYANLYFNARNPMMYKRKSMHTQLGVVSVSASVLELPDVVVSDGNGSSDYTRFGSAAEGLRNVSSERTFTRDWTHPDTYEYYRRKRAVCAEVLVPGSVRPRFIRGIYVSGSEGESNFGALCIPDLKPERNPDLFFQ